MPYYHVHIVHHDPSRKGPKDAYELDLSEEQMIEQIVKPYLAGKTFMCGGQPIDAFFVDLIKVSESDETSLKLIPKLRAERARKSNLSGIIVPVSDNYLVVKNSRNVTRKFVPRPPEKKEFSEKREKTEQPLSKNIFIVHGKNHEPMKELKIMLYDFGLNPIVLHEKASGGLTLAEKLEKYSDAGYAFVILTPDDVGCQETEVEKLKSRLKAPILKRPKLVTPDEVEQLFKKLKPRARQNVIFEMGYFWGLLKRQKVCCLLKGDVERPSDIEGIVYVHFKESVEEARYKIIKELTEAGYEIKM